MFCKISLLLRISFVKISYLHRSHLFPICKIWVTPLQSGREAMQINVFACLKLILQASWLTGGGT